MPSSILSHQAPGLWIKIKYPQKFDGTALCISTFVPDLNIIDYFLPFSLREFTHSLLGLILWTIPLTIIFTVLFCRFIGPIIANIAKKNRKIYKPLKYFGIDEWGVLKNKKYTFNFFIIAIYSAFIGGLTHLLLDLPSHQNIELFYPWIILQNPDFLLFTIMDYGTINIGIRQIEARLTVYGLIWIIETWIGLIFALYLLRYIKKHNLIGEWYKAVNRLN